MAEDDDSFGTRLRKWRKHNHYTQDHVADLIYSYRSEHNLKKVNKGVFYMPEKSSVLRTYQNWESSASGGKDTRISMTDLYILKIITGCDYEYFFGEINTAKVPSSSIYQSLGLCKETIDKLELYAHPTSEKTSNIPAYAGRILSTIDLIVSDDVLLSNLTYYLYDMVYYPNIRCSILKPERLITFNEYEMSPEHKEYNEYLFPQDNEMRNLFLPAIFVRLENLRNQILPK